MFRKIAGYAEKSIFLIRTKRKYNRTLLQKIRRCLKLPNRRKSNILTPNFRSKWRL